MEWGKKIIEMLQKLFYTVIEVYIKIYCHFVNGERIENRNILVAYLLFLVIMTSIIIWCLFALYDKISLLFFDRFIEQYNSRIIRDRRILKEKRKCVRIDRKYQKKEYDAKTIKAITESECETLLKSKFPDMEILKNVYIDNPDNEISNPLECGIIGITKHGVYLLEVQNYGGYVYPSNDSYWLNAPYDLMSNVNYKYNPVERDSYCANVFRESIQDKELISQINRIVVFGNNAMLVMPKQADNMIGDTHICNLDKLEEIIKKVENTDKIIESRIIINFIQKYICKFNKANEIKLRHTGKSQGR